MKKILLRPVTASDLPIFFEQQLDPDAVEMAAFPSRNWEAFDAHWAKIRGMDSVLLKTIEVDGRVAGNIVCWSEGGEREVGYWLGKEFWSKGIATQALREFLEIEKTRPLRAHVATRNAASRRVLEKCGFKVVGRQWLLDNDGNQLVEELIFELGGS